LKLIAGSGELRFGTPDAVSFGTIKRELRRRPAIKAVIGHLKTDSHLSRCYLKDRVGTSPTPSSVPSVITSNPPRLVEGAFATDLGALINTHKRQPAFK
jgi:IS5 family transposase